MEIVVACPHCGLRARLPDTDTGGVLACPGCGQHFPPPAAPEPIVPIWVDGPGDTDRPIGVNGPEPADAPAHLDWLRAETKQFNDFVAAQLAELGCRRLAVAAEEARLEARFIPREQELSRRQAVLTARADALRKREQELARREAELARLATDLTAREASIGPREERVNHLEPLIADLDGVAARVEADRTALHRRQAELDRAMAAAAARQLELDELEQRLRLELETEERNLESRRRALEWLPEVVRSALANPTLSPPARRSATDTPPPAWRPAPERGSPEPG